MRGIEYEPTSAEVVFSYFPNRICRGEVSSSFIGDFGSTLTCFSLKMIEFRFFFSFLLSYTLSSNFHVLFSCLAPNSIWLGAAIPFFYFTFFSLFILVVNCQVVLHWMGLLPVGLVKCRSITSLSLISAAIDQNSKKNQNFNYLIQFNDWLHVFSMNLLLITVQFNAGIELIRGYFT